LNRGEGGRGARRRIEGRKNRGCGVAGRGSGGGSSHGYDLYDLKCAAENVLTNITFTLMLLFKHSYLQLIMIFAQYSHEKVAAQVVLPLTYKENVIH
jgi:hypothetical protein